MKEKKIIHAAKQQVSKYLHYYNTHHHHRNIDATESTAGNSVGQYHFFTSYEGAQSVLDDARRDAADKGCETKEMWDEARLSAVNMEFALKLGTKHPRMRYLLLHTHQ